MLGWLGCFFGTTHGYTKICSRCFVVLKFFCDCDLETVTLELGCETLKHSDPHVCTSGTQVLMGVTLQAFKLRLLQLLLFTSVAVALFGGSFVCFGFYLLRLKDEKGAMQLLPPAAAQVLGSVHFWDCWGGEPRGYATFLWLHSCCSPYQRRLGWKHTQRDPGRDEPWVSASGFSMFPCLAVANSSTETCLGKGFPGFHR